MAGGIDSYTKLMLHMDGADNGTVFTDDSLTPHSITRYDALTKTGIKKFGSASGYFDGTGDYLSVLDSDDWNYGGGDFTIDLWLSFDSGSRSVRRNIVAQSVNDDNNICFFWHITSGLSFFCADGGSYTVQVNQNSTSGWTDDVLYHIALVRSGNTWKLYRDGIALNTVESSITLPNLNANLKIASGNSYSGSYYNFKGYIDELRISKGIARWTSDFTPPTVAYDDIFWSIEGTLSDDSRIIVIDETTREVVHDSVETTGAYFVGLNSIDLKTIIAVRESDGNSISYGRVIPAII